MEADPSHAAARTRNKTPEDLRVETLLSTFKSELKMCIFTGVFH